MKKLIYTVGPVASGKTTFSLSLISNDKTFKRINRDSMREMSQAGTYTSDTEEIFKRTRNYMIESFLNLGYNVVVDDTNLSTKDRESFIEIVNRVGNVELIEHYIHIDYDTCFTRNNARNNPVPLTDFQRIWNMYLIYEQKSNYVSKTREETLVDINQFYTHSTLEKAIILDLDNTIAMHKHGRDPYDFTQAHSDIVNIRLNNVLNSLKHVYKIIIITGRSEVGREETVKWLRNNDIPFEFVLMRPNDKPFVQDRILKKEIYLRYVQPEYNVCCVFEDREQNVDMWRDLNLLTFHVEYGRF